MPQTITVEMIRTLGSEELAYVKGWAIAEEKERAERHKQETIAKIKALARSIEVGVKIAGTRGRPAKGMVGAQGKPSRQPIQSDVARVGLKS